MYYGIQSLVWLQSCSMTQLNEALARAGSAQKSFSFITAEHQYKQAMNLATKSFEPLHPAIKKVSATLPIIDQLILSSGHIWSQIPTDLSNGYMSFFWRFIILKESLFRRFIFLTRFKISKIKNRIRNSEELKEPSEKWVPPFKTWKGPTLCILEASPAKSNFCFPFRKCT